MRTHAAGAQLFDEPVWSDLLRDHPEFGCPAPAAQIIAARRFFGKSEAQIGSGNDAAPATMSR